MITTWEYPQDSFGYSNEEIKRVWKDISNDKTFWLTLSPYKDTYNFISALSRYNNDFYFITSRPGKTAKLQTELWLDKFSTQPLTVLISSEKGLCAKALKLDYYIDDKTENCIDVDENSSTKCFMLAQPWNRQIYGIERINSIMKFMEVIKS
jgi:uncharacterized HAD superfamily protein